MKAWIDLKKKETKVQDARSDVFYTLVPINRLGQVCGLVPVKLARNELGQTDFPLLAYGITLALALTAVQFWGMYRDHHDDWKSNTRIFSRTMILVTGSDGLIVIIMTLFAIIGSSSRWKPILQALDKIVRADEKLEFTTTRNIRRTSVILITCTFIYLTFLSVWNHLACDTLDVVGEEYYEKGPINYCPLHLMYGVIAALEMQYAVILMNLGERFNKLNSIIEELTKTNAAIEDVRNDMRLAVREPQRDISPVFPSPNQSRQHRLERASSFIEEVIDEIDLSESIVRLIKVYDLLCESISHLNKAFGVPVVTSTIGCLIHLVITLYFLFIQFNTTTNRLCMFIRQIGWVAFHIYNTLLFVQPSHMVASKARKTGSLVSQALACNWNPKAQRQLERFTMHVLHRPVEFTACGLFYLNRGLMASIAGAVTTYLVILLQFQSHSNDDTSTNSLLQNASVLLKSVSGVGGL